MKIGKSYSFLMALGFVLITSHSFGGARKTIDVGVILRLNDKYNGTVHSMMAGIYTAKNLFEKRHANTKINLHLYSHSDDLESVLAASSQAIKDRIPAVIGAELSEEGLVLGETLGKHRIILMSPTGSNPNLTKNRPLVFVGCFSDAAVSAKLARFTANILKPKTLGVIRKLSSPYSNYLSRNFIEYFNLEIEKRHEAKQVSIFEQKILKDTKHFDQQIEFFIKNNVTHVAMLTHQIDLLGFVAQAERRGYFPVYIGSDGWGRDEGLFRSLIAEKSKPNNFVGYRNTYWKSDSNSPMSNAFNLEFRALHDGSPDAWSAVTFDTAWLLFLAMQKSNDPNSSEEIAENLKTIKNLPLVSTDQFSFGSDRFPLKNLYIYKLDQHGFHFEETMQ